MSNTLKVVEVLAESPDSWEAAAQGAVAEASKSLKNIRSVWVQEQSAVVEGGKIVAFRVNLKLSFVVERD